MTNYTPAYTTASEELNKAVKELMPGYLKGEYIKMKQIVLQYLVLMVHLL